MRVRRITRNTARHRSGLRSLLSLDSGVSFLSFFSDQTPELDLMSDVRSSVRSTRVLRYLRLEMIILGFRYYFVLRTIRHAQRIIPTHNVGQFMRSCSCGSSDFGLAQRTIGQRLPYSPLFVESPCVYCPLSARTEEAGVITCKTFTTRTAETPRKVKKKKKKKNEEKRDMVADRGRL